MPAKHFRSEKISVVTPCYNEEAGIRECVEGVREVYRSQLGDYELEQIFCDNCWIDRTVEILEEIAAVRSGLLRAEKPLGVES
jgi:glycosyltransferase involved in cell wall biosynthesis